MFQNYNCKEIIMKMLKSIFVGILFIWAGTALASVPQQINYQGFLTTPTGTPLDTTVAITFKLYSDSIAISPVLWAENHPSVTVAGGLFNVRLGQLTALGDTILSNSQLWLGIAIGSDFEMTPRTRVVSVGYSYRVGTVDGASGGTISGKLNVGSNNTNIGDYANVLGQNNTASNTGTTVGGGEVNTASGNESTVGGGKNNKARGDYSVVAGGGGFSAVDSNSAFGANSTISGGKRNKATATYATIGGGYGNTASGGMSTVGGGYNNTASEDRANVSAGYGNTASGWAATVSGGSSSNASGRAATVSGGYINTASDSGATVSGGWYNRARGNYAVVAGGGGPALIDSNSASGNCSAVGGGRRNLASATYTNVSGGIRNIASGECASVGGGNYNSAGGYGATVGGGNSNIASGDYATVAGGNYNHADTSYATVGGGHDNIASDYAATVPGGNNNHALAQGTFAAGSYAYADDIGAFVWADTNPDWFHSLGINTFNVRASGGIAMFTDSAASIGVTLNPNDNTWNSICDSTKKTVIRQVDSRDILDRVVQLPIKRWTFKDGDPNVEHISPMAQDFWNLFHVGSDSLMISNLDPSGIALAAIQELDKKTKELNSRNQELASKIHEIEDLKARLAKLEALVQSWSSNMQPSQAYSADTIH
jgi:hypothetical protein